MAKLIFFVVIITVIFMTILVTADAVIRMVTDIHYNENEEETAL